MKQLFTKTLEHRKQGENRQRTIQQNSKSLGKG